MVINVLYFQRMTIGNSVLLFIKGRLGWLGWLDQNGHNFLLNDDYLRRSWSRSHVDIFGFQRNQTTGSAIACQLPFHSRLPSILPADS